MPSGFSLLFIEELTLILAFEQLQILSSISAAAQRSN
jgi:hypothetical protein